MTRGHRVESTLKHPLISDYAEAVEKTSFAIKIQKEIGDYPDSEKAKDTRQIRSSKGKISNRLFFMNEDIFLPAIDDCPSGSASGIGDVKPSEAEARLDASEEVILR